MRSKQRRLVTGLCFSGKSFNKEGYLAFIGFSVTAKLILTKLDRNQYPLPSMNFSSLSVNKDSDSCLWMTARVSTCLDLLNGIWRILTGSKSSVFSTTFVFKPICQQRCPPRPLIDQHIFSFSSATVWFWQNLSERAEWTLPTLCFSADSTTQVLRCTILDPLDLVQKCKCTHLMTKFIKKQVLNIFYHIFKKMCQQICLPWPLIDKHIFFLFVYNCLILTKLDRKQKPNDTNFVVFGWFVNKGG